MMKEIKKMIKTNDRSRSMLIKYYDLMPELEILKSKEKEIFIRDNQFNDALTIGTKTN
jgi:hypothetical protein